ncbi:hypothetical protein BH09BAC3_BH09BAC3_06130 [soil metagenome]
MFAQVHTPDQLLPSHLDAYLERGWFRMGQTIFTTNFLHVKEELFSTIWLRILLSEYKPDTKQEKLFKRNASFQVEIASPLVDEEREKLYTAYKQSVPFRASDSLRQLLYSGKADDHSIYNTLEITVRHDGRLIACGYFDIGEMSAQGIVSFYDPEYRKYSLGKYLIYLKIQYCKDLNLRYFYPGYFVPGNPYFDYKLDIGRPVLEFLELRSRSWLPISAFSEENIPMQVMYNKLVEVHSMLLTAGIDSHVLKYEFFDVNLMPELRDNGLFDFPVFLFIGNNTGETTDPCLIYDVRDDKYHLLEYIPVWKPMEINPNQDFYSDYFLKATQEILATSSENEMADIIKFLKIGKIRK